MITLGEKLARASDARPGYLVGRVNRLSHDVKAGRAWAFIRMLPAGGARAFSGSETEHKVELPCCRDRLAVGDLVELVIV